MIFASSVATENEQAEKETKETQIIYTLKEYQGRLAVYKYGQSTPYEIFEIQVSSLPEEDAQSLKKGIQITNEKELKKLISDFTS